MSFINGALAAAGLACVALPILIHLLMRRRRKPIQWGAMRFLQEAYRRHRRRLRLERWLLLIARCILVAAVGLAIGRPLLGTARLGAGTGRTVYVLIDNGLAAQVRSADGRVSLAAHLETARAALSALQDGALGTSESDRAGLITLAGPSRGIVSPPSSDIGAVRKLLDNVMPTEARTDLRGAFEIVARAIEDEAGGSAAQARRVAERTFILVLSDFRLGSGEVGSMLHALPAGVTILANEPAKSPAANVSISGVEPLRSIVVGSGAGAAGGDQVRVMLKRSGAALDREASSTVRVTVADPVNRSGSMLNEERRATVRWRAGQESQQISVQTPALPTLDSSDSGTPLRSAVVRVRIDDDSIAGDNIWRRPVQVRQSLKVGVVSPRQFGGIGRADRLDTGAWLRLALRPGEGLGVPSDIEVIDIEPGALDSARLSGLDALILPRPDLVRDDAWQRIGFFAESGGMVMVTPPPETTVHVWWDAFVAQLGLDFELARETMPVDATVRLVRPQVEGESGPRDGLLSLLDAELEELARPVHIAKVLPIKHDQDRQGAAEGANLLSLSDGTEVLWVGAPGNASDQAETGRGLVVYLALALDLSWTDLPARPLMVPLMQELVRQGIGRAHGAWWTIAGTAPIVPSRSHELVLNEDQPSVLVEQDGTASAPLRRAGLWKALDERGSIRGIVAVNADAHAGAVDLQRPDEVERWLVGNNDGVQLNWVSGPEAPTGSAQSVAQALSRGDGGSPISLALLGIGLVAAVMELFLARLASHAAVSKGGQA